MKYGQWREQFIMAAGEHGSGKADAVLRYDKMYAALRDEGLGEEAAVERLGDPGTAADGIAADNFAGGPADSDKSADAGRAHFAAAGIIDEIELDIHFCSVEINFYDGGEVLADYPAASVMAYKISERGGKIKIDNNSFEPKNLRAGQKFTGCVKVCLPNDYPVDIKADLFGSDLKISGGTFGNVSLLSDGGTITAGRITCADANIISGAGSVCLDGIICHRMRAEVSAGRIKCAGVCGSTAEIYVNAAAGEFGRIDCKRTEIDVSMGAAAATFCGGRDDYDADVKKLLGATNIVKSALGRERSITARVSLGRLNAGFGA